MNIQKITRSITLVALFLIPIFPLIVANHFFFPFITGKGFYFRVLVEIAFAGWVILAFVDAKYRPKISPLTIGITLFALITLVADLLGVNPIRSLWSNFERMEGWLTIIHLWALFIVTSSVFGSADKGKVMWHRWFNLSIVVALIVACYGLGQLFGWTAIHQGSTRLDASLGNAAYLAVYMLFHAFLAVYMFFVAKAKKIANYEFLTWTYPVLALLFSFILFETATRGTILGLIGGIMLALAVYAIFAKKGSVMSRSISGGIIIALIILGGVFWANRTSSFVQKHEVLQRFSNISWTDSSNQARQYIWPMAVKGSLQRPIFGWGQENFNYIFNSDYNPKLWSQEQWFDRAHNVFLDWLVASGFVGLLAYLALYVLAIIALVRSSLSIAEKSVLLGLIAGYAVHNIFVFDNLASYVMFFAILGFAHVLNEGKPWTLFKNKQAGADATEYIIAPITIAVLIAGLYFLNVRPIQANTGLIDALQSCGTGQPDVTIFQRVFDLNQYVANQEAREQLISCADQVINSQQAPGPIKQAIFQLATAQIQAQVAATPKDARIYVLAGGFLNDVNQIAQAMPLLETAHKLSPGKQSVDFQLATDYVNTGKITEGMALLKQAYDSDPSYPDAQSAYASGLVVIGKDADARTLFNNDPTIFDTTHMAAIYVSLKQYDKAIAIYKKLIAADPTSIDNKAALAQIQFAAGLKWDAVQTLKSVEADHPELKTQVEAAIKEVQK